jgi:molybdopterin-guanine dinucleotide biosynthesis protein A
LIAEDREPQGGPLVGLASALPIAGTLHSVVLSCDAPFIKPGVIELLFDSIGLNDVALPTAFGREQFFPAVYHRNVGGIAQRLLERNERRMSALAAECKCSVVAESRVLEADPMLESFLSVNTPPEFEAFVRRFESV